jgi:hypothetical protein
MEARSRYAGVPSLFGFRYRFAFFQKEAENKSMKKKIEQLEYLKFAVNARMMTRDLLGLDKL